MLKELFRATAQHDGVNETLLVVSSEEGRMYPISKTEIDYGDHVEYHYSIWYWFARTEEDVDIMTVLQYFLGEPVNVPEDFEIDHP